MITIRPVTASDIEKLHGSKSPLTLRGYTALLNGVPVAIAGITLSGILFSNFTGVKAHPVTVWRTAKKMLDMIREFDIPAVTTECDGPSRFLESLGLKIFRIQDNKHFYRI